MVRIGSTERGVFTRKTGIKPMVAGPRLLLRRQVTVAVNDGQPPARGRAAARAVKLWPGGTPGRELIEHRQGRRRPALVLVELVWRDGRRCGGLIHDIGPEGMYVLCGDAPADARCVEVVPAASVPVRIPGFVVHRHGNGLGLMFRDLDAAARDFVRRCLR